MMGKNIQSSIFKIMNLVNELSIISKIIAFEISSIDYKPFTNNISIIIIFCLRLPMIYKLSQNDIEPSYIYYEKILVFIF